jgi:hypothetical protein
VFFCFCFIFDGGGVLLLVCFCVFCFCFIFDGGGVFFFGVWCCLKGIVCLCVLVFVCFVFWW